MLRREATPARGEHELCVHRDLEHARLTASAYRVRRCEAKFGFPANRRFPMNDAEHARLAIGGATRSFNAGNITAGQRDRIQAEARAKLKG